MERNREVDLFAVTAPGLEALCRAELGALGIAAAEEPGGVAWRGGLTSLYRANLHCRTASRVLARLGSFRARTFAELERHAARLPWDAFVARGAQVSLRISSRKSRLYHTGAIAERLAGVLAAGGVHAIATGDDEDEDAPAAQLVVIRFLRDECTVSIDASGALLHQRGYRQALAKAPLRETIAAALLAAAGWRGDAPLLDPFCGSGTIPIEAALQARRIPPGIANPELAPRAYAFEKWPGHDAAAWARCVTDARAAVLPQATVGIVAADRHGGAITAARANAERAGVAADIEFRRQAVDAAAVPAGAGWLVTNPPYGVRVGERRELFATYAALGRLARRAQGWTVAFLSADPGLEAAVGLPLRQLLATRNGGIAVRLLAVEREDAGADVAGGRDVAQRRRRGVSGREHDEETE